MTEMQAAIGRKQLSKLESWNIARTKNVNTLTSILSNYSFIRIPDVPEYIRHAYYKFYVFFHSKKAPKGLNRDLFIDKLCEQGLMCMQGSCHNITYEKAFSMFPDQYRKKLPHARYLGDSSIMFLVDHTIDYDKARLSECLKLSLNAFRLTSY